MTRARSGALALALATALALGACTAGPAPTSGTATPTPAVAGWQQGMLNLVNAHRANAGLAPLSWCPTLGVAAQNQSQAQAAQNRMFHADLKANANAAGYTGWRSLAENVAAGQSSAGQVMDSWMNSSGHRANILGAYTHVGFGLATSSSGVNYWTQSFGTGGRC